MKAIVALGSGVVVMICDQLLKNAIARNPNISVTSWIGISNTVHPWGISALSVDPRIYTVAAFAILALICIVLFRYTMTAQLQWALALVIGGGASNLIDHLVHGQIIETFYIASLEFNLADIALLTSVLLIFHDMLLRLKKLDSTMEKKSVNEH